MPAMAGHAGLIAGNPAIALVLAVGMLGYLLWAIDQLLSPARRRARTDRLPDGARGTLVAPRLAAWQKITMGLAMGYMLVTML